MNDQKNVFRISANQLAEWIGRKGPDQYWTVDGDRVLNEALVSPCSGDELEQEIRKVGKPLVIEPPMPIDPESIDRQSPTFLDDLCEREELGVPVLQLRWEDSETLWLLYEDEETSESVARDWEEANAKDH